MKSASIARAPFVTLIATPYTTPCAALLAAPCAVLFIALLLAPVPARADESGIIISRHEFQAADLASAPDAQTVGEFLHRSPPASLLRAPGVPLVRMANYTIETSEGKRLHVTQKADSGLEPGVHVVVHDEQGVTHLVAQNTNP